jgi:hypothetical protein
LILNGRIISVGGEKLNWKKLNLKDKKVDRITLEKLEMKMNEEKFDKDFKAEIVSVLKERMEKGDEEEFQKWLSNLHFRVPEEFQDEQTSIRIYERHHQWLEVEVTKLEKETKLSWEIQTEDSANLDDKARKAQLVIRHRLSEIVLDLSD